jgi:predicted nucleotidyltransferase component of viral defense system
MKIPELESFGLVGGTALSLKFGHRISVDLDFFCHESFENSKVIEVLGREFGSGFKVEQKPPIFGIFCYINDIKVDLVRHPHPMIRPVEHLDGIRMYSNEDIIAMKVQAILGRAKKKDFWDIAELLTHYPVADFVKFHQEKFSTQNLLISVPQAITYFSDAAEDENPVSLKGQTWEKIQKAIQRKVSEFLT